MLEAAAPLGDEPAVGASRGLGVGGCGMETGGVGGRHRGPAQVLEGAARDHEHEEVKHGEEAELERD